MSILFHLKVEILIVYSVATLPMRELIVTLKVEYLMALLLRLEWTILKSISSQRKLKGTKLDERRSYNCLIIREVNLT